MKAEIAIRLKDSILDPQGQAVMGALSALGYDNVTNIRIGRLISLEITSSDDDDQSENQIHSMCKQLLANQVMESYTIRIFK